GRQPRGGQHGGAAAAGEKAVAALPSDCDRTPPRPDLYLTRARWSRAAGDREAARRDYQKFIAGGPAVPPPQLASACVELAHLEFQDDDYEAVLDLCSAALKAVDGYPPAHRQRAHVFLARKDHERAGKEFDLFLRENRKANGKPDAEVYRARGHVHVLLRQYPEAVVAYTEALAHGGAHDDTLFRRGSAYLALNSPQRALADFES